MDQKRIPYQMSGYDWLILAEAINEYIAKNLNFIDTSELADFADHIEDRVNAL